MNTLRVDEPWDEAQNRLGEYERASETYLAHGKSVRDTKTAMSDREAELIASERGANPEMKITEFNKHMKVVIEQDEAHSKLRAKLGALESDRALAKSTMDHHELGIKVCVARMHELGGLLEFYAAAKTSQRNNESTKG